MKKYLLTVTFSLLCGSAWGADIAAESKIFAVTVFPDRADVSRLTQFDLPKGKHTVVFNGLPSDLITDSLRVSAKGKNAFSIGSVETKKIFTQELTQAEEKKLQDQITALQDKRRFIEAEIKAAETGKAFLESLSNTNKSPVPLSSGQNNDAILTPDVWKNAWQTIQNGMNLLGKETIEKQIQIRAVDNEIAVLKNKLKSISTGVKSYKQVRVNLESGSDTKAEIVLQYQIAKASWTPLYEARLNSSDATVELVQYGNIMQKTGENWDNVLLTLSTAQPSVTMRPPALTPLWLNLRSQPRPLLEQKAQVFSIQKSVMTNFMAKQDVMADSAFAESGEEEVSVEASYGGASVQGTEFSGVFAIKGLSNVPSDGSEYRFNIGTYSNKAELHAEVYPAIDPKAYLIASMAFNGELPLLPGSMALFRDGAFIGNSYMDMLRPNEKLNLSFGQDEKIRITYTLLGGEISEGGVITKEKQKELLSRTIVQNLHNQPIQIAVYERLPISRNSDITVKILKNKTTAGYTVNPNNKVGVISWDDTFQPYDKKEINYGYSVSWPKDMILSEN